MADEDNEVTIEYGARLNKESFDVTEAEIEARNARIQASTETTSSRETQFGRDKAQRLRNESKLIEAYQQEGDANAEKFLRNRINRENLAQKNAAAIAAKLTQDEQTELKRRLAQEKTALDEGQAIRRQMKADEALLDKSIQDRQLAATKAFETSRNRIFAESVAIRKAMRADEAKRGIKPDSSKLPYDVQRALEADIGSQRPLEDKIPQRNTSWDPFARRGPAGGFARVAAEKEQTREVVAEVQNRTRKVVQAEIAGSDAEMAVLRAARAKESAERKAHNARILAEVGLTETDLFKGKAGKGSNIAVGGGGGRGGGRGRGGGGLGGGLPGPDGEEEGESFWNRLFARGKGRNSFAERRAITEAGTIVGAGPAGTIASFAAYGPQYAAFAGVLGTVAIAFLSIKQAIADTSAELNYAAVIRSIGQEFVTAKGYAEEFRQHQITSKEDSYLLGGAFAKLKAAGITTSPEDIKKIGTIGTARGETPVETAKVLEGLRKADAGIFEEQTGLNAARVIDEYAKAHKVLPETLVESAKAQALYNKYLEQAIVLEDIALKQRRSPESALSRAGVALKSFGGWLGNALIQPGGWAQRTKAADQAREDAELLARQQAEGVSSREIGDRHAAEVERSRLVTERIEKLKLDQGQVFRGFDQNTGGKTTVDRYKEVLEAQEKFKDSVLGLDPANEEIRKLADAYNKQLEPAINEAHASAVALQKDVRGSLVELAGLQLGGEKNPYVQFFAQAEDAARKAHDRFKAFGPEVEATFTKLYQAEAETHIFELKIGDQMQALSLEFAAANLAKPFFELTGEMKRTLNIFNAELSQAVHAPSLLAEASQIETATARRGLRGTYGNVPGLDIDPRTGLPVVNKAYVQGQEFERLQGLRTKYSGVGGQGGEEVLHGINTEMIRLFGALNDATKLEIFRNPNLGGAFASAFRGEADYGDKQIDLAAKRAAVSRQAVEEATAQVRALQGIQTEKGPAGEARRDILRSSILGVTGGLAREDLTPELLKARISALTEEAQHRRLAENAAIQSVAQGANLQRFLEAKSAQLIAAISAHDQTAIIRILNESDKARTQALGPVMGENTPPPVIGFAPGFRL